MSQQHVVRQRALCMLALGVLWTCLCTADEATDQFNFATGLLIKKEYELSAEEFSSLLKEHPKFEEADVALYRLGDAYRKLDRQADAIVCYERVIAEHPKSLKLPQTYYQLGLLISKKDHKKAARYYGEVAVKWPDNKLAEVSLYWSAEEWFKAGEYTEAAKSYSSVVAKHPGGEYAAPAMYSQGWSEFNLGRFEAAAAAFRSFLAKYPKHKLAPDSGLKLAESLHAIKKYDEALVAYGRVKDGQGTVVQDAAIGAARCLYDRKSYSDAAQSFIKAAAVLKGDPRAGACMFNAGNAYVMAEDFSRAADVFGRMSKEHSGHPLTPRASYWNGYCLIQMKQHDKAVAVLVALKNSGKLKEKNAELLQALGEALSGQKDYRAAAAAYIELTRTYSKHDLADDAAYNAMLCFEKAGDLAAAEKAGIDFMKRFKNSDVGHLALFALAEYRFRLGKYKESAVDLNQLLATGKQGELGDDVEYKLGWCAAKQKQPAAAGKHFSSLVDKYPNSPFASECAFMAGQMAEDANDRAAARKHYTLCRNRYAGTKHAGKSGLALVLLDLHAKDYAAAEKGARVLLGTRDEPVAEYALIYLGEALLEQGKHEAALNTYQQVAKDGKQNADASYGVAWALRRLKRHKAAAEAFLRVAAMNTDKAADAQFWACRSVEDSGKFVDAASLYAKFVRENQRDPHADEAAYRQALCASKAGERDAAVKLYLAYTKAHPRSELVANALYDLSWLYRDRSDTRAATAVLQQLLKQCPKSDLVQDVMFRLGEMAQANKDYKTAAEWYEKTMATRPAPFGDKVLYKLGWCYDHLKEVPRAADTFALVMKDFPDSELAAESSYRSGVLLKKSKQYDRAVVLFLAVNGGEFREKASFGVAECLRLSSKHGKALEAYDALLQKFPKTELAAQVHLGKGHCLRSQGAFKDAVDSYGKVVKATDTVDAASALLGIGYSHYAMANYKDAARAFLKVDIIYGYEELKPEALKMLSQSWEKGGKADKARKYRDELRQRYPDSKYAKE